MPTGLVGNWTSEYAVVSGQQVSVYALWFGDDYLGRNPATIKLQFTSNGSFSQIVLDLDGATLWNSQGTVVLHGQHMTCTATTYNGEPFAGAKMIDGPWSMDGNRLVLSDNPPSGVSPTSIIYSRE